MEVKKEKMSIPAFGIVIIKGFDLKHKITILLSLYKTCITINIGEVNDRPNNTN